MTAWRAAHEGGRYERRDFRGTAGSGQCVCIARRELRLEEDAAGHDQRPSKARLRRVSFRPNPVLPCARRLRRESKDARRSGTGRSRRVLMKPFGPGVVFVPALLPWLLQQRDSGPVVEIEPQTLWQLSRAEGPARYTINDERFAQIAQLPGRKLIHSVGMPFGGAQPAAPEQIDLVRRMADAVNAPWVSDHLSFNAFKDHDGWVSTGYFLPPRQTAASVAGAAAKIETLSRALNLPVAFETGVNYLQPDSAEMPDGSFFGAVADAADCGILLDIHNLWVNACN